MGNKRVGTTASDSKQICQRRESLGDAISSYAAALEGVQHTSETPLPTGLTVLLARDRVAELLGETGAASLENLDTIVNLDQEFKAKRKILAARVDSSALADWREALDRDESAWWWSLEERDNGGSRLNLALTAASWLTITISLGFIAEILRRFLSGGADALSAVLQGLAAFLVGSTLIQYAKQLTDYSRGKDGGKSTHVKSKPRVVLAVLILLIAVVLGLTQSRIARYYNDRGNEDRERGSLTSAIQNYQHAISLSPDYALAHYGLARAYEDVQEYDKAITEYQTAILADDKEYRAYSDVARMYLLYRKDPARALQLLNKPIESLDVGDLHPDMQYALYKNRGWANLSLQYLAQAKDDLQWALTLRGDGVAAHYLLGKVYEAQNLPDHAKTQWKEFLRLLAIDGNQAKEIQADWLGFAEEQSRRSDLK